MIKIKEIEKVTEKTLSESRKACYQAFERNIDYGASVEDSCRIIKEDPQKRIHSFWREALIAKHEEKIIAGISMVPYSVRYKESTLDMVGIGDVFCIKKGTDAIKSLFTTLFENYKDFPISVLYPFSDNYYARYGYASVFFKDQLVFKREYLLRYFRCKTTLKAASTEDIDTMNALYESAAKEYALTALRTDPLDWKYNHYAINDHGYMAYWISDKNFVIRESIGLTCEEMSTFALKTLPELEELIINTVFDQDLFRDLPEHNQNVVCFRKLHGMARIINLEKALKAITHKGEGSIRVRITDEMIEKNNRTILYSWNDKECTIEDTDSFDFTLDIKELTALFCLGSTKESFKDAFPINKCACYEFF